MQILKFLLAISGINVIILEVKELPLDDDVYKVNEKVYREAMCISMREL